MSKSKVAPSEQLSMEIEQVAVGWRGGCERSRAVGSARPAGRPLRGGPFPGRGRPGRGHRPVLLLREARGPVVPRSGRPPRGCWSGSGAKDGPGAGGRWWGVRWEQADAAAAVAGSSGESVRGLRDAALSCSDGLLRVSEAADLESEGANTLTIRRSKTDQEGGGRGPVHRRADGGTGPGVARGPRVRPLATDRRGAVPGRRRGLGRRDADRRPMAIPLDARPLCQGPARRPRRGRQAPLTECRDRVGVRGRLAAEQDRLLPRSSPVKERLPGPTGRELKEA